MKVNMLHATSILQHRALLAAVTRPRGSDEYDLENPSKGLVGIRKDVMLHATPLLYPVAVLTMIWRSQCWFNS